MAHPQIPREINILAQRQHTACAQHPAVAHDHRAVMHGRLDEENILQKLAGNGGIQHGAAANHIVQQDLPLKDDQRTGAGLGHLRTGQHRLADGPLHGSGGFLVNEESCKAAAAHLLQNPADLRLEQDDQGQQPQIHHAAHDIIDPVEVQCGRKHQCRQKDQQPLYQTGRLRTLHQCKDLVEDKGHNGNVQNICNPNSQKISNHPAADLCKRHSHCSSSPLQDPIGIRIYIIEKVPVKFKENH